MAPPDHDPSIEHEPHLRGFAAGDPSEARAIEELRRTLPEVTDAVDNTVWDEPALRGQPGVAPDEHALTYSRWLAERRAETTWPQSLAWMAATAAVAGPFGILGALMQGNGGGSVALSQLLLVGLVAPVTEEVTKVAATMWVVEKRPYWFKQIWQVLLCAVAGGAMFGVIENLIYLNVYIPDAGASLARWRWSVCTGLHMNCSLLAGVGLARVWDHTMRTSERPELWRGIPWMVLGMVGHGIYNVSVTIAETAGWLKFLE